MRLEEVEAAVLEAAHDAPALGLEPDQIQAAILLASGMAVTKVAERVGVDRRTVSRWREHSTFAAAFERELSTHAQLMREVAQAPHGAFDRASPRRGRSRDDERKSLRPRGGEVRAFPLPPVRAARHCSGVLSVAGRASRHALRRRIGSRTGSAIARFGRPVRTGLTPAVWPS